METLWKMPQWMEAYRDFILYTAGKSVEHWQNAGSDREKDVHSWFQKGVVAAQVRMLTDLNEKGRLCAAAHPGAQGGLTGEPGKFRKRPVVIDAFRMGIDPRPDWFQDKVSKNEIVTMLAPGEAGGGGPFEFTRTCCEIKTLEGVMRGEYGDWIIRGVKGEVYPCKPDIFAATYEPAFPPPPEAPQGKEG